MPADPTAQTPAPTAPPLPGARDYWLAYGPRAGLLWIFQHRLGQAPGWYVHGPVA